MSDKFDELSKEKTKDFLDGWKAGWSDCLDQNNAIVSELERKLNVAADAIKKIGEKEWVQGSSVKLICTEALAEIEGTK